MYSQDEFNLLVTNVMAISNQILARHCGQFLTEIEATHGPNLNKGFQDLGEFSQEPFNYEEILKRGYASLETLTTDFNDAWEILDPHQLHKLLASLPSSLPGLNQRITAEQCSMWVEHFTILPEGNSFNELHQYCHSLFNGGSNSDEVIRLAIADDKPELLEKEADNITSEMIRFDDINTALMIESIKCFEWLVARASISDDEIFTMLEYLSSDPEYFAKVYGILSPNTAQHLRVLERVKELEEAETLEFLNRQSV